MPLTTIEILIRDGVKFSEGRTLICLGERIVLTKPAASEPFGELARCHCSRTAKYLLREHQTSFDKPLDWFYCGFDSCKPIRPKQS